MQATPICIQDLAVKVEGAFILRYRVFDIFSKKYNDNELTIQTECYGGPFRVYSTKDFPGLQASTELTKVRFDRLAAASVLVASDLLLIAPLTIGPSTMGCTPQHPGVRA